MKFSGTPEPWMIFAIVFTISGAAGFAVGVWVGIRIMVSDIGRVLKMSGWVEFKPEERVVSRQMVMLKNTYKIIGPCWQLPDGFICHDSSEKIPFDMIGWVRTMTPEEGCGCSICNVNNDRVKFGMQPVPGQGKTVNLKGVLYEEI